jgi:integrase/recombinase XerD
MTTIVTVAELADDVETFLSFKRAMGSPYRRGQWDLESFVRFVARQWGKRGQVPLDEAITRWCERIPGRKAVTGNEFGPIRQLCLHRRRRDPSSYVPEHALAPIKESTFLPYIFSHDEVRQILAAATVHKGRFIGGLCCGRSSSSSTAQASGWAKQRDCGWSTSISTVVC